MYPVYAKYRPVLACSDASRTKQAFLKDSLIGSILKRFQVTGVLDQPNSIRPQVGYGEHADFQDLANHLTQLRVDGISEESFEKSLVSEEVSVEVPEASESEKMEVKEDGHTN